MKCINCIKKGLLLLVAICSMGFLASNEASASVKIDATNFPDEVVRQEVSSAMIDANEDGTLSDEELKKVTDIAIGPLSESGIKISTLKGMEYFPNIIKFYVQDVKVSENILPYLPKLEQLVLCDSEISIKGTAPYLKEIETFGTHSASFSGLELQADNLKSIKLYCSQCAKSSYIKAPNLENLDVVGGQSAIEKLGLSYSVKKLKNLKYRYNAGANLTFPGHTGLEALYLYNCDDVKLLDASGLKNLKEMDLVNCGNLKKLDLSASPKLTRLDCTDTPLANLNVKKNTKITRLKLKEAKLKKLNVTKNKNLKFLDITGTQIKSIDLSKNKKLNNFRYIRTKMNKLDLSKNTKLKKLGLNGSKIKKLILPNVSTKITRVDYDFPTYGHNAKTEILDLSHFKSLKKIKGDVWSKNISLKEDFCKKIHSLKKIIISKKLKKADKKYIKKLAKKCKVKVVVKK